MVYPKEHADFITITCLEWKPVLSDDKFKDIIIESLRFLTKKERIAVFALCKHPEDYYYSSASFYYKSIVNFDFLAHYEG